MTTQGLDTEKQVFFYEQEFYPLSNFSAFAIERNGKVYPTSEHLYHAEKFTNISHKEAIRACRSAHEAFKLAHDLKQHVKPNWNDIKVNVMLGILWDKVNQHPYVKKKLIDSGDRELIENSWRDDFWGWGENKDGQNQLGQLWMSIRHQIHELGLI